MDIESITATVAGLKATGEIVNSILHAKTSDAINAAVREANTYLLSIQSDMITAQAQQFLMIEEIRTLKKEIAEMKTWETEKQRYQLISPWNGSFVYSLKDSMKGTEPPHWICVDCYEKGVKSIVQERGNPKTAFREYFCKCGTIIHAPHRGKGFEIKYV